MDSFRKSLTDLSLKKKDAGGKIFKTTGSTWQTKCWLTKW
jgi:hypothetical protein